MRQFSIRFNGGRKGRRFLSPRLRAQRANHGDLVEHNRGVFDEHGIGQIALFRQRIHVRAQSFEERFVSMMLRPRPLHINWFAFDEVQFTIWQGRTNFTSDSRQHFSNVSENLCFGHLTDGNPSYDFRLPAISARTDVFLSQIWFCVHLEGAPASLGFQHGFLLAPEISDAFPAISTNMTYSTKREWTFFRQTAREMLWPKIDTEYQQELQGIAEGLNARTGSNLDVYDIVAMNAFEELPDYYVPWLNKREKAANPPNLKSPGNCSAFVATGSWTKDGKIVIAHNNWTNYMNGERWRIIFDIEPKNGFRMLMDGIPGVIASDDDFGINSDGLMVTETTISQFEGWDPNGKAEFVRARKALQYAGSIDEYTKIMLDGNKGGYAQA